MNRFFMPKAPNNKDNEIMLNGVRICAISDRIVRVEKATAFEDRATKIVVNRNYDKSKKQIKVDNNKVTIVTNKARFVIDSSSLKFQVFINGKQAKVSRRDNLKGTIRTLDGNFGIVNLPEGIMSKSGVTVLDDSKSALFNEDGTIEARDNNVIDFYILAFGHNYLEGLNDFYNLSGREPIIPKYALGNWWSRYHAYSDREYLSLMDEFKNKNIPFTVATVDMDWHIVKNVPKDVKSGLRFGAGWTGYTFEKSLFPNYKEFLKELKDRNLHVSLNLHPKDGVRYFENQYEDMAKANDINPSTKKAVEFDLLNTKFRDSYFDILHHPYEKDGVDLWWIDWQQGTKSKVKGIDPLLLLNHYHYLDINREENGIILSRYCGLGSHRYPLGFSGDTIVCWRSLRLQPYFTCTASNVGYTWWSHDIGGHMCNKGDNELYLRWLQLGVFSPINRLHSTNNTLSKEPWLYKEVEKEAIKYLQLRHSLIAYCYSASIVTSYQGVPICSPLYYFYDEENAYNKKFRNEFIFASNLLVCPVTAPKGKNKNSIIKAWLPKGNWINIFNGEKYIGSKVTEISCPINEYPVFAKEGSFLPLLKSNYNEIDYTNLLVKVFVGTGDYELFDDNGSIKFSIKKENDGYKVKAEKVGNILTKTIEYQFVGKNIKNITIDLENIVEIFVKCN